MKEPEAEPYDGTDPSAPMNTPPANPAPNLTPNDVSLSRWIARQQRLAALWLEPEFRRDGLRLLVTALRGLLGVRIGMALALLAGVGVHILRSQVDSPEIGYQLLARLFGLATVIAAAPIYAAEQTQGTFELLWLATGSQKGLLRFKVLTLIVGISVLMVPSVLFVAWYLYGTLPIGLTLFSLITQTALIIATMALVGTYLPQPWAGGLVGGAILVTGYVVFEASKSPFNLFLNPLLLEKHGVAIGNRMFVLGLVGVLLAVAARRLKSCFD